MRPHLGWATVISMDSTMSEDKQAEIENPEVEEEVVADQAKQEDSTTEEDAGSLEEQLQAAQDEIGKLKDGYLRAKAEEDNVRRRSEKEIANSRKFAIEGFAKELLNVHDSLRLASDVEVSEDSDEATKSMRDGLELTLKQLDSALTKFAVAPITAEIGDKPDPNLHQAMSMIDSEEVESGCIINVIQPGFTLNERVLRPAMVVVAK